MDWAHKQRDNLASTVAQGNLERPDAIAESVARHVFGKQAMDLRVRLERKAPA